MFAEKSWNVTSASRECRVTASSARTSARSIISPAFCLFTSALEGEGAVTAFMDMTLTAACSRRSMSLNSTWTMRDNWGIMSLRRVFLFLESQEGASSGVGDLLLRAAQSLRRQLYTVLVVVKMWYVFSAT